MKIQDELLFLTQSSVQGLGHLYVRNILGTASLFYRNPTGFIYSLEDSNGRLSSSSLSGLVTYFTGSTNGTSASFVYNKPFNAKYIKVMCLGGGGGGGSGMAASTAAANRRGGGGGGGGACVIAQFPGKAIPSSVTVTVGGGGAGGIGVTGAVATNGRTGSAGGTTSFGTFVVAPGGGGGSLGYAGAAVLSAASGGLYVNCVPTNAFNTFEGCFGGRGINGPLNPPTIGLSQYGGGGGGSGGGINVSGVTETNTSGSSGHQGYVLVRNPGAPGPINTTTNGGDGGDNLYGDWMHFTGSAQSMSFGLGGGGHGGSPAQTVNGGNGGNGGRYGAGGGGGGVTRIPNTSGAGGSGSAGLCFVIAYL